MSYVHPQSPRNARSEPSVRRRPSGLLQPSARLQCRPTLSNTSSKVSTPVTKTQKNRPLFSYSCSLLLPQLPCFEIHLVCRGGGRIAERSLRLREGKLNLSKMNTYAKRAANPRAMNTSKIIGFKASCNQHLQKNGGGRGLIVTHECGLYFNRDDLASIAERQLILSSRGLGL
jgi:hypothetical protein